MAAASTRRSDLARGPDGAGGGAGTSLADQLFNAETVAVLGSEHAHLPGFDRAAFETEAVRGLAERSLMQRIDWIATCLEAQLPRDFPALADALEDAMPPPLDSTRRDDDFGRFIHAVPGVLAVRHGLEMHPDRALDLLHAATQRFSMEYYIRPFLDRWPEMTLARLEGWAGDPNYHVRRLVSEGTRPRLPWAQNITLAPDRALPLLDMLHADPTRYVTRSVANHLNDLTKSDLATVVLRLEAWRAEGRQGAGELDWITRHALRTAVKRCEPQALKLLGYDPEAALEIDLDVSPTARIGEALQIAAEISAASETRLVVDYRIRFHRPSGRPGEKVFKLGTGRAVPGAPLTLSKRHPIKAAATTFTWHPGPHVLILQVNGRDLAEAFFDVV
ncbi:3-methyladenine DNA glycosylase AlkC [Roseivivax halotolerans]|uniref:3-methyladenine DNA glycosylase AlkC n=1 Tax=Roseivivax halotolerans TaxID=93684 RepID=A0A1I5XR54_9RHOB|nr:hypothetical protein [Roseivivax halotolerans]SFQ34380.1 3-methyladenine DNA glycosylase AlkC [Roseivivax halotolerans]